MPVILDDDAVDALARPAETRPEALQQLLVPGPDDLLIAHAVSQRVNSVKNDDPDCIEAVATLL